MKKLLQVVVSVLFLGNQIPLVSADSIVVLGASSAPTTYQAYQSKMSALGHTLVALGDKAGKYDNDNSFVQLYHPISNAARIKVVNRKIMIVVPSCLSSDLLMETLIRIRGAKTFGGSQISVFTEGRLSDVQLEGEFASELSLEDMLAVAGADAVQEGEQVRKLIFQTPNKKEVSLKSYWIGGSNHPELLNEISGILGKQAKSFSELQMEPVALQGRKVYWVAAATPPVNNHLFKTLAQIRWMARQGATVHLISPYLFYARSDKPEFDVGVTTQGRLVADLIEAVGTQGITVVRAHAPQSLGFFKIHSQEISGRVTLVEFLKSEQVECVISPDAGFQKDATKYQHDLAKAYGDGREVCLVVMNKERNSEGKERLLGGTGLEKIRGKHVVIIDDETATGGTLGQVSQMIQEYKPKSTFAVVTHLAGPAQKGLNSNAIGKLIVTNTLPIQTNHPKLKVLSIASEIAASIAESEENRL